MKYRNFTFLIVGLLLSSCKPNDSKKQISKVEKPIDTLQKHKPQEFENKNYTNSELSPSEIDSIRVIINLFKQHDIDKISHKIKYPLNREYPIPPIKNKKEFKERFSQIFDHVIINKIVNSQINQWSEVGWGRKR